jgi:hypothetical protein
MQRKIIASGGSGRYRRAAKQTVGRFFAKHKFYFDWSEDY